MKPEIRPRKRALQSRAAATRAAICEAAAHILEEVGSDGFTTNHIAKRAGVSIGSLYQYFPNKESILAALVEEWDQQLLTTMQQSVAQPPYGPKDKLSRLVTIVTRQHFSRPGLTMALERAQETLPLQEQEAGTRTRILHLLGNVLAQLGVPAWDLERTGSDMIRIVRALTDPHARNGTPPPEDLDHRIERTILGYLQAAQPGGS